MMDWEGIAADLGAPLRVFPHAAMLAARAQWEMVAPHLLRLMEAFRSGADRSPESANILFFLLHMAAEKQERCVFAPLCALVREEPVANDILGDSVTETLACMLVRTYDGDPAPLRALIEDAAADEFVRNAAFEALAWLTASGQIARAETAAYLRQLVATMQPQGESFAWSGWQDAVGWLGLTELRELAAEVFRREWVAPELMDYADFEESLNAAVAADGPMAVLHQEGPRMFDDAIAELSEWSAFTAETQKARDAVAEPTRSWLAAPYVNPFRNIGRNDPCPCGSGKKFKKCCLGKV